MPLPDQQSIYDLCVSKMASGAVPTVAKCSAQLHGSHSQTPAHFFPMGALPIVLIPGGEEHKSEETGGDVLRSLPVTLQVERESMR